jgi:radical SAM superfamily enzyme YgiQ (UPF0313 family)
VEESSPDLIAFTVVSDDYAWALRWAAHLKARFELPIVFGNVHPTLHPEEVLREPCVDFVVRGEGELTLLELVEALGRGRDFSKILGLGYKDRGQIRINPMRPLIEDMDILPFPDKDLYYERMPYLNHGYTTLTGRGCPYRCSFCDNTSSAKLYASSGAARKWTRRHSPERVVAEILWAKERYGIRHVRFNDEDFSYNKQWTREFCELYREKVRIPYFAWVYPNTIDREIARLMADSGCDSIEMGIQSGSEHLRTDIMKRRTSDEQIVTAMRALRDAGIRATADIIIGLPSETKEDLDETVDLLRRANPWHLYAFWLRYYPATEILTIAKERRLLSPEKIAYLENSRHSRGHLAGGTELERDGLSRSYHAFVVLMPLFPDWLIGLFRRFDLIRFFPSFLSPFLLVNFTKAMRRDAFNEFRIRGWKMLLFELPRQLVQAARLIASGGRSSASTSRWTFLRSRENPMREQPCTTNSMPRITPGIQSAETGKVASMYTPRTNEVTAPKNAQPEPGSGRMASATTALSADDIKR